MKTTGGAQPDDNTEDDNKIKQTLSLASVAISILFFHFHSSLSLSLSSNLAIHKCV